MQTRIHWLDLATLTKLIVFSTCFEVMIYSSHAIWETQVLCPVIQKSLFKTHKGMFPALVRPSNLRKSKRVTGNTLACVHLLKFQSIILAFHSSVYWGHSQVHINSVHVHCSQTSSKGITICYVMLICIILQVSQIIIKRQTLSHMERDMERWLKVRRCRHCFGFVHNNAGCGICNINHKGKK